MKRLGVLLLPPGWDASPLQGYPQNYPFIHLGGERHCQSKVSARHPDQAGCISLFLTKLSTFDEEKTRKLVNRK